MHIFTTIFYQPVFNALVLIYLGLEHLYPNIDMGIAVIILTIVIRIIILPLALASDRSVKEKHQISLKLKHYRKQYSHDPITYKQKKKELLTTNRSIVISEIINLTIQITIAVVFYKIFTSGVTSQDFHLLYDFVPKITHPFNLMFLGKFDLTIPNQIINFYTALIIFVAELLIILASPFKASKKDGTTLVVLPIVAFMFFSRMPVGKKLFVATSLSFTILLTLAKILTYLYYKFSSFLEKTAHGVQDKISKKPDSEGNPAIISSTPDSTES